eukprot:13723548-Heterocapsa_arctica.AAC.1
MPRAVFGSDHEQHPPREELPSHEKSVAKYGKMCHRPCIFSWSVMATSNLSGTSFLVKESPLCRSDA